jgi:hypothetical protein
MRTCPNGWTNTTTKNCTECIWPCATCSAPKTCITCVSGYNLLDTTCVEIVYWPYPFVFFGIVSFIVILVSEFTTKRESRFKEAFIALLSLLELGSWIAFLVFHYLRQGYGGSFFLAGIATLIYMLINLIHMVIHIRMMVPNSTATYKSLANNFKCSTYSLRIISYLFSFKFSLILVSYLCMNPRLKGDYSALNWKQFNRFSLTFICFCYPTMMFACSYYLYSEGLFSYPGFISIEVIALSTLIACLMLLDAVSAIRCCTKTQKQI